MRKYACLVKVAFCGEAQLRLHCIVIKHYFHENALPNQTMLSILFEPFLKLKGQLKQK